MDITIIVSIIVITIILNNHDYRLNRLIAQAYTGFKQTFEAKKSNLRMLNATFECLYSTTQ